MNQRKVKPTASLTPVPVSPAEPVPPSLAQTYRRPWLAMWMPAWVLLPLRLFFGVTFVYAGLQKLTDPQYFHPGTIGYIGRQISGFAVRSPISGLLVGVAEPHARLVGALVAYGELAIGVGTLVGLLYRPAVIGGLLLNLIFFLSASWRVYPYFYGADIVFIFGWLALLLAGRDGGGWPSLDAWLMPRVLAWLAPEQRQRMMRAIRLLLGGPGVAVHPRAGALAAGAEARQAPAMAGARVRHVPSGHGRGYGGRGGRSTVSRRDFVRGAAAGGAGMLVLAWLWGVLHPAPSTPSSPLGTSGAGTSGAGASASGASASGTPASSGSNTVAQVSQVPANSAASFTIPSNQDPGVLVHLNSGAFVAFDAVCTHAGCIVQYDPGSRLLLCPCHGAEFDPAHQAAVVAGPAPTPLAPVAITVDNQSGAISINS